MQPSILDCSELVVFGTSIRTSFASAIHDIPAFWARTMAEDCLRLSKAVRPIYAVYSNYDSDFRGAYSMHLAAPFDESPDKLEQVRLLAGRYARFVADGDPAVVVASVWEYIWFAWPERERRAYATDYEIHGVRGPGTTDILIGMR